MNVAFRGLVLAMVVPALTMGCGSSSKSSVSYPDADPIDAGGREVADTDGGGTGDGAIRPPPMSGEGNVKLFAGRAQLLSNGPSCTSEVGATADRWCAFTSKSAISLDGTDLFVVNLSKAAAGTAIACGGGTPDPNCLKLTAGFFEETEAPITHAAGFQGDTLVFFDRTGSGYGWRPGMSNARVLAAGGVRDCFASQKGASILCLRDVVPQPTADITQSELLAGRLDAPSEPPLTRVDTVISNEMALDAAQQRFRVGFLPDGEYVAWSSRAAVGGPEILKTQKVGDDSTRVTVATDVSRWSLSPDGTRWYWLSQFNYDITGMRAGTLQSAPFPTGAAPTTLLANVADFNVSRSGALAVRTMVTGGRGTLQAIADPVGAPTAVTTLDTGVIGILSISPQGYVAYSKTFDPILRVLDLFVRNADGVAATCPLVNQPTGRQAVFFLPGGGAVLWARVTNLDADVGTPLKFRLSLTRLADCTTAPVASDVSGFGLIGDTGVVFADQYDGTDATLRVRHLTAGNAVAIDPALMIHTRADDFFSLALMPGVVLFTVNAASSSDGLYLHVVAPPGAGATDAGATDAGLEAPGDAATDASGDAAGGAG